MNEKLKVVEIYFEKPTSYYNSSTELCPVFVLDNGEVKRPTYMFNSGFVFEINWMWYRKLFTFFNLKKVIFMIPMMMLFASSILIMFIPLVEIEVSNWLLFVTIPVGGFFAIVCVLSMIIFWIDIKK